MAREILSLTISVSYVGPANISWNSSGEFLIVYPHTRPLGFLSSCKELSLQSLMRCPYLSHSLLQKCYFNMSYTELPFISAEGPISHVVRQHRIGYLELSQFSLHHNLLSLSL